MVYELVIMCKNARGYRKEVIAVQTEFICARACAQTEESLGLHCVTNVYRSTSSVTPRGDHCTVILQSISMDRAIIQIEKLQSLKGIS